MEEPPGAAWNAHDIEFMTAALEQARRARDCSEVPVGCVIVRDGCIIGRGHNMTNAKRNGTRHAEFEAIDVILADVGGDVAAAGFTRCVLYVTIEPCIMCAAALSLLRIKEVIFGARNDKFGGCGSILRIHEDGCGSCGKQVVLGQAGLEADTSPALSPGYRVRAGLLADQAIELLQEFYSSGNPTGGVQHMEAC